MKSFKEFMDDYMEEHGCSKRIIAGGHREYKYLKQERVLMWTITILGLVTVAFALLVVLGVFVYA